MRFLMTLLLGSVTLLTNTPPLLAYQNADSLITVGVQKQLYSAVLKENRSYQIHLPNDYHLNTQKKYPVIYVLDGEINFNSLSAITDFLSRGRTPTVPQMIVVGVLNTNRTRDLTPSHVKNATDMSSQKGGSYAQSGGSSTFLNFVTKELMPEINKQYRSSGFNIYAGHSFGGLSVLSCLYNHTNSFDAFIAMDPSLWWDNGIAIQQASNFNIKSLKHPKKLVISSSKNSINQSAQELSSTPIVKLDSIFTSVTSPNFSYKYFNFDDETHGTLALPSLYYGLKYLFKKDIR